MHTMQFKKKCKLILFENENYSLASRRYVKEQTLAEMLTSNKYTKLQASNTFKTLKGQWREKLKKLKAIPATNRKITVSLAGDESAKISSLEAFCTELSIDSLKTHKSKGFEKNLIKQKSDVH